MRDHQKKNEQRRRRRRRVGREEERARARFFCFGGSDESFLENRFCLHRNKSSRGPKLPGPAAKRAPGLPRPLLLLLPPLHALQVKGVAARAPHGGRVVAREAAVGRAAVVGAAADAADVALARAGAPRPRGDAVPALDAHGEGGRSGGGRGRRRRRAERRRRLGCSSFSSWRCCCCCSCQGGRACCCRCWWLWWWCCCFLGRHFLGGFDDAAFEKPAGCREREARVGFWFRALCCCKRSGCDDEVAWICA